MYNGTNLQVTDTDPRVLPYHTYQYMVSSVNSAGTASSQWARVTTRQAPPAALDAPVILVSVQDAGFRDLHQPYIPTEK